MGRLSRCRTQNTGEGLAAHARVSSSRQVAWQSLTPAAPHPCVPQFLIWGRWACFPQGTCPGTFSAAQGASGACTLTQGREAPGLPGEEGRPLPGQGPWSALSPDALPRYLALGGGAGAWGLVRWPLLMVAGQNGEQIPAVPTQPRDTKLGCQFIKLNWVSAVTLLNRAGRQPRKDRGPGGLPWELATGADPQGALGILGNVEQALRPSRSLLRGRAPTET